jgi:multiple sugar transport system substrate-binding protein
MAGSLTAGAALAACQPKTVIVEKEVEKVVKETVVVEKEKVVKETVVVETGRNIFEGELQVWHGWGNSHGGGLAMIDLTERFAELYPDVEVVNVYDANTDKILAALAGGNPPDTMVRGAPNIPEMAQRGVLMDLDPFVDRDNWDMSQYFDFAVEHCSWRGRLYAMTHHPHVIVFWRNQGLMQEAGLDPESTPQDWTELLEMGKKITVKEDDRYKRFGYIASWTAGRSTHMFMQANGADIVSEDGRTVLFNSDKAVEAVEWWVKMIDDICGGRDSVVEFQEANATPEGKRFIWMYPRDLIGMALYGNWMAHQISVVNPELKTDVGTFPGGPSGDQGVRWAYGGGTMMVIPKDAEHWELAWEWLKFLGSEEGGWLVQKRTGDISGRIESAKDPRVLSQHLKRAEIVELLEKANGVHYLPSPISAQFATAFGTMEDQILLDEVTIAQGIESAADEVQKALDEFWATV